MCVRARARARACVCVCVCAYISAWQIILSLHTLLTDPNPSNPLRPEVAKLLSDDPAAFNDQVSFPCAAAPAPPRPPPAPPPRPARAGNRSQIRVERGRGAAAGEGRRGVGEACSGWW